MSLKQGNVLEARKENMPKKSKSLAGLHVADGLSPPSSGVIGNPCLLWTILPSTSWKLDSLTSGD